MTNQNKIPTFNMKVVVQETGLTPDTLRAWERRYGMPSPERTEGGHRLYSQYEIEMLKWLIARQEEGLSISNAIDLWRQLKEAGEDPVEATAQPGEPGAEPPVSTLKGDKIDEMRKAWLEACLEFDEHTAQHILAQAFAVYPVETVCFEILQKGLNQIGLGWSEGTVTVQQEHFTSGLAIRQLEALIASLAGSLTPTKGHLLVACPPHEQHTFSSLLLTLMLRHRGWDVIYLGANVPVDRLEVALQTVKPDLVILVAQTLHTAGTMLPMADLLHQKQVPLAFGGAVFSYLEDTRQRIPGYFLGENLAKTPETIAELIQARPPRPKVERASAEYEAALAHYRANRSAIEADVEQQLDLEALSARDLHNANEDLGDNLDAALALGSMDLLDANIDWVQGLLVSYHYRMPDQLFKRYIKTYQEAINQQLDERGQPLKAWFETLISNAQSSSTEE